MFDFVRRSSNVSVAMRLKTMTVSGLVHSALIVAAVLLPLRYVAPSVPISSGIAAFAIAAPAAPPPPPPAPAPAAIPRESASPPQRTLAPIEAPQTIEPEKADTTAATTGVVGGVEGGVSWGVAGGIVGGLPGVAPPPPPPPPPPAPQEPVRVGSQIKAPALIKRVEPEYPAFAQLARIQGTVVLEATVDKAGKVTSVKILRSAGVFDEPAITAVKQWRYLPLMLNGQATPFILTVTLGFHISG